MYVYSYNDFSLSERYVFEAAGILEVSRLTYICQEQMRLCQVWMVKKKKPYYLLAPAPPAKKAILDVLCLFLGCVICEQ